LPVLWKIKESEEDTYTYDGEEWDRDRRSFTGNLISKIKGMESPCYDYQSFVDLAVPKLGENWDDSFLKSIVICQNAYKNTILSRLGFRPEVELEIYKEIIDKSMSVLRNLEAYHEVNSEMNLFEQFKDNESGNRTWGRTIGGTVLGIGGYFLGAQFFPEEMEVCNYLIGAIGFYLGFVGGGVVGNYLASQENRDNLRSEFDQRFESYRGGFVDRLMDLETTVFM